eukprot:5830521-Heterocapsa_arctica.AAC.1
MGDYKLMYKTSGVKGGALAQQEELLVALLRCQSAAQFRYSAIRNVLNSIFNRYPTMDTIQDRRQTPTAAAGN